MIRDATPADFAAILALNAASVQYTSPLDALRLHGLHAQAAYHRVIELDGGVRAFLLALREGSDYDSPNYGWFVKRYPEFLYIDRIVVDAMQQGRGLGAILYDDLFAFAARTGVSRLTCEFDLDPPNPVSARLHARYVFREVGRQHVAGGKKQVSLQARELASAEGTVTDSGMIGADFREGS